MSAHDPGPVQAMLRHLHAVNGQTVRDTAALTGASRSSYARALHDGVARADPLLRTFGVEAGSWPAPPLELVAEVLRWWTHHPLDRVVRVLLNRPDVLGRSGDVVARALLDDILGHRVVPVGPTALLFLLPPRLVEPVHVLTFATVTPNAGATAVHPRLGPVRVADAATLGLPEDLVPGALWVRGAGLLLPRPRHLLTAAGWSPGLAAAARVHDLCGDAALTGRGRRRQRLPWRTTPAPEPDWDVEDWDPGDPALAGCEPDRYPEPPARRTARERLGI